MSAEREAIQQIEEAEFAYTVTSLLRGVQLDRIRELEDLPLADRTEAHHRELGFARAEVRAHEATMRDQVRRAQEVEALATMQDGERDNRKGERRVGRQIVAVERRTKDRREGE